jgi:hypothetical protein
MTYIVARASPERSFMISDTLLTTPFPLKGQEGPVAGQHHALKVHILGPKTAIGFSTSNDVDACLEIIKTAHARLVGNDQTDIPNCVFEEYAKQRTGAANRGAKEPDCDFLVLELKEAGNRKLRCDGRQCRDFEELGIYAAS